MVSTSTSRTRAISAIVVMTFAGSLSRPRIVCGALAFDAQTGVFELDGLALKLTALEWRVLECLILKKDVLVDRTALAENVYEGDIGTWYSHESAICHNTSSVPGAPEAGRRTLSGYSPSYLKESLTFAR